MEAEIEGPGWPTYLSDLRHSESEKATAELVHASLHPSVAYDMYCTLLVKDYFKYATPLTPFNCYLEPRTRTYIIMLSWYSGKLLANICPLTSVSALVAVHVRSLSRVYDTFTLDVPIPCHK